MTRAPILLACAALLVVCGCGLKAKPDHWEHALLSTGDSAWVFIGDTLRVRVVTDWPYYSVVIR